MDKTLLEILACPQCKGPLVYKEQEQQLWCISDKLAYPIKNQIPVMLVDEALELSVEQIDAHKLKDKLTK